MEPRAGSNPAEKVRLYVSSVLQPRKDNAGRSSGRVWNWTEPNCWATTGHVANSTPDFGVRFPDQVLCFLYSAVQKPSCGHFAHIEGNAHVSLF